MHNPFQCNFSAEDISFNGYFRNGSDRWAGSRSGSLRTRFFKSLAILAVILSVLTGLEARALAEPQPGSVPPSARRLARRALRQNRLSFVPLAGQAASATRFAASGPGFQLSLDKDSMTLLTLHEAPAPAGSGRSVAGAQGGGLLIPPPGSPGALPPVVARLTRLRFLGANPDATMEGRDPSQARVNFLIGNDPAKWQRNLVTYSSVRYANLYPGVDLVYYGEKNGRLEYDLVVAPGADPAAVRLQVDGDREPLLDENGDLHLDGKDGDAVLRSPMLYQDIANGKKAIVGSFVQIAGNEFGFKPAQYDHTRPLVIDPTFSLLYSTFMGGIHEDAAGALALDAENNVYITGITASQDFPVSANAFLNHLVKPYEYELNTFVMKFDSSGTLLFSTYLGGSGANGNLSDAGHPGDEPAARSVGLDAAGNVYLTGTTTSTDFPVTANAYQSANTGTQVGYLAELSPDGSTLEYGSYFGGSTPLVVGSMARAANGQIYVAGSAGPGLPTTAGAYKMTLAAAPAGQLTPYQAAFLSVFDFAQSGAKQLVGSTYYGTDTPQANQIFIGNLGYTMALDSKGDPWLVGQAYTNNLPTTANAYQPSLPALTTYCGNAGGPLNSAGYIAEFNPTLTALQYGSYLSGMNSSVNAGNSCSEYINGLAIDSSDNIYVDGATGSGTFPVTAGSLQPAIPASSYYSEFIAKLKPGGATINWATYLGGSAGSTFSGDLTPDAAGNVWAVGITAGGSNFPISSDAYQATGPSTGNYAGFIDEISPDGAKLVYGTYFGGDANTTPLDVAVDANENVYVTGSTTNTAFPVTANALQPVFANGDQGPDSSDAFFSILGAGTIGLISPIVGGNTGDTTITVDGAGLQQGATCSIVDGGTTIASVAATVNSSGTAITCTFALNGAATGSYNVVITNPDGSSFTKQGGFMVESGGSPDLSVQIVGRPLIRTGFPTTFQFEVSNSGNENAYFTPIWITVPVGVDFSVEGLSQSVLSGLTSNDGTTSYVSLLVPQIAPGQTETIPVQIESTTDSAGISLSATIQPPWFSSVSEVNAAITSTTFAPSCVIDPLNGYFVNCFGPYMMAAIQNVRPFVPSSGSPVRHNFESIEPRPDDGSSYSCAQLNSAQKGEKQGQEDANKGTFWNFGQNPYTPGTPDYSAWNFGYGAGQCAGVINNIINSIPSVPVGNVIRASGLDLAPGLVPRREMSLLHPADDSSSCTDPPPTPPNLPPASHVNPQSGSSIDPNFKSGSTGDGSSSAYVRGNVSLPYDVGFENEPTAALPAAAVVVTDQLDPSKVDLTTVSLGAVSFGSNIINLPTGTSNYTTTYTPTGVTNYVVRIQGSLNPTTGLLKWTFQTIDPTTGLPPTDPTVGFLPPDTNGIVGQGSVLFNVMPKAGQTTGAQITNRATVVFDANAPINTPTWLNTLDVNAPVSHVTALPATEAANTFTVSWSGADVGSGIASYTIYVSDNGGPFTAWQASATATSASFTASAAGHTYGFYSIATDGAGNTEAAKSAAEATTEFLGVSTATALTSSSAQINVGSSVTLSASVTPASGTAAPTGTATFMLAGAVLGSGSLNASGVATYTTTALPVGTDAITAVYSGDANFASSTSSAVSVTVVQPQPDFTLATSPATITVVAGTSGSSTLTVSPVNGFNQTTSFSCSGLPALAACSFSPTSVTPSGAAITTTVTISTTATTTTGMNRKPSSAGPGTGMTLAFVGGFIFLLSLGKIGQRALRPLSILAAVAALGLLSSCGGPSKTTVPGTPTGTSTITIAATAGSGAAAISHNTTISLTVQ